MLPYLSTRKKAPIVRPVSEIPKHPLTTTAFVCLANAGCWRTPTFHLNSPNRGFAALGIVIRYNVRCLRSFVISGLCFNEHNTNHAVTGLAFKSASKIVNVNCRNIVVKVKRAARLITNLCVRLVQAYICQNNKYSAREVDRMIKTVANLGRGTPRPSSRMPASIEHATLACIITAVLNTTAAISVDVVVQPTSATFFQVRLSPAEYHRKLIYPIKATMPEKPA
jgi:hypothetical protein